MLNQCLFTSDFVLMNTVKHRLQTQRLGKTWQALQNGNHRYNR